MSWKFEIVAFTSSKSKTGKWKPKVKVGKWSIYFDWKRFAALVFVSLEKIRGE